MAKDKDSLKNHVNTKDKENTFKSDLCKKSFNSKNEVVKHVKTIHLENNHLFKCNLCEESYTKQKQFEEHKANVHAIQFRCELCDKTFKIRRCLLRHLTRQHKK